MLWLGVPRTGLRTTAIKSTFRAFQRYQMFGCFTMTTPSPWSSKMTDTNLVIKCNTLIWKYDNIL